MTRPSGLLSVAVVLLSQSLPRRLSVPRSIFWLLSREILDGVLLEARCDERWSTLDILVRLFPFMRSDGINVAVSVLPRVDDAWALP